MGSRYRQLRIGIIVLTAMILVTYAYVYQARLHSESRKRQQQSTQKLADAVEESTLFGMLRGVVHSLGTVNQRVRDVASGRTDPDNPEVLKALSALQEDFDAEVVFVMNRDGTVVASTNYNADARLTGNNYAFRSYFQLAMQGKRAVYPAIGVTTIQRGLYYSAPVFGRAGGSKTEQPVVGVFVIKSGLGRLEQVMSRTEGDAAFVSPEGVVFAASRPDWMFKAVRHLSEADLQALRENRRFSYLFQNRAPDVIDCLAAPAEEADGLRIKMRTRLECMQGEWSVITYIPNEPLRSQTFLFAGLFAIAALGVLAVFYVWQYERRKGLEGDRKRLMREHEETYNAIFNSVNEAIFVHALPSFELLDVNRNTKEVFGYTREEMLSGAWSKLFHDQAPYRMEDAYELLSRAEKEGPHIFEWMMKHRSGRTLWIEASLRHARIGERDCVLAVIRDENERKALQTQIVRSERLAAVGTLAAGIAHEFNNINVSILGFSDLGVARTDLDAEALGYFSRIRDAARRAKKVIAGLLAFARPSEKIDDRYVLNEMVERTLNLLRNEFTKNRVGLHSMYADLPVMRGNEDLLGQVVINLAINAIHAMIGCDTRELSVTTGIKGDSAYLRIADTGCGIPDEELARIFSPFFTTKGKNSTKEELREIEGTGLGLSISNHIVEQHNGRIDVESTVGKGTTFTVWLPLASGQAEEPTTSTLLTPPPKATEEEAGEEDSPAEPLASSMPEETTPETSSASDADGVDVLVLEDEPDAREFLELALGRHGYRTLLTGDGEKALAHLHDHVVPVAIVDLMLPGMTGIEFMTKAKALPSAQRPVMIVVTGNPMTAIPEEIDSMVFRLLEKPFVLEELSNAVSLAMNLRETM